MTGQLPPVLVVRDLVRSFGGVRAASDVSFDVADKAITALIGPNGAGKTTVFNLITNLVRPDAGEVLFRGASLKGLQPTKIASLGLIRTFQSARVFPGMSVLENVMVGRRRLQRCSGFSQALWSPSARAEERDVRQRAEAMLELVRLSGFRDAHAVDLPMGAQKLLEVARALMAQPRLMCLDEPAAGLNDTETHELAQLLGAVRASGIPVLVVEHNMSLVMTIADHVVVLEAGTVITSGRPADIRANPRVIEAYLGRDANAAA